MIYENNMDKEKYVNTSNKNTCIFTLTKIFFLFLMFIMMLFVTFCIVSIYITICEWKPFFIDVRDGLMHMA
jgi:uncharacterized Tic20 family protein